MFVGDIINQVTFSEYLDKKMFLMVLLGFFSGVDVLNGLLRLCA